MTTNKRAAEAMALDEFKRLSKAQQRAMSSIFWGANPKVQLRTNKRTVYALQRLGICEDESRWLTTWGRMVAEAAQS